MLTNNTVDRMSFDGKNILLNSSSNSKCLLLLIFNVTRMYIEKKSLYLFIKFLWRKLHTFGVVKFFFIENYSFFDALLQWVGKLLTLESYKNYLYIIQ